MSAGAGLEAIRSGLRALPLEGYSLVARPVVVNGIAAIRAEVVVEAGEERRRLSQIEAVVSDSHLSSWVKREALSVFRRLARAEASVHGVPEDDVTFDEVGALDALVDVIGTLVGLEILGVENVFSSPLPLGRGLVECEHGTLPVPAPAVVELLKGAPTAFHNAEGELVTPTGAAIVTTLAQGFGDPPPMVIESVGYGAGARILSIPNVLRLIVGERTEDGEVQRVSAVEANLDDATPQLLAHLADAALQAGALDAYIVPAVMKKGRPGHLVTVLCQPARAEEFAHLLLRESTTLGVRIADYRRIVAERQSVQVETPYGTVRVKLGILGRQVVQATPEYEDCVARAAEHGVPLKEVQAAAVAAWRSKQGS